MARKLAPAGAAGKPRKRKSAADKAADEAQALDPTARITVGGEEVVVREYGFFQKQRVLHHGRAFVADVEAMVNGADVTDLWDDIKPLVGVHEGFVRYAIAEAIGKPQAFVDALGDDEIEPLTYLWFGLAGRFFFEEISLRVRARRTKAALAGSTSSTPSAATSDASASARSAS